MFQHVTTLFSFIFAIALTHVLASASELILARERVRFSWLHGLWMISASLGLLVNWLSLAELDTLGHWSVAEVLLQLSWVVPQYFTCSLIAMRTPEEGEVDMQAFFEKQRPVLFSAFAVLMMTSMLANYGDRNNFAGWKPGDWIGADLLVLPMLVAALVAGWARPAWLQWSAITTMLGLQAWFLVSYAVTGQ